MNLSDPTTGVPPLPVAPSTTIVTYGKKILVVLPWYKSVNPITSFCVGQLIDRRRTASMLNFGDAFVTHSRNSCADAFLRSDCEWMLTIDDDMIVPFGNADWYGKHTGFKFPEQFLAFNAIDRLISHKKSLVGALYFGRHRGANPVYNEGADKNEAIYARKGPHDQVKPTKWVGTGCMLIHRSVYLDIEKKFPTLARGADGKGGQWFTSTEASLLMRMKQLRDELTDNGPLTGAKAFRALELSEAALAAAKSENTLGYGEDVSFCMRATAAGHQAHVDMGLICGHIGHAVYGPQSV